MSAQMTPQPALPWRYFLGALLLAIILAAIAIVPPSPRSADAEPAVFSAMRAMDDVRIIAKDPHPTGSVENAAVRDYLTQRMSDMGLEVDVTQGQLPPRALSRLNRWRGTDTPQQDFYNIIGTLNGTNSNAPALLLMAHHDTVWASPGASDDTIGIAAILEITRAVQARGPQHRDLIVLFTDAEELGLVGAKQFFETNPLSDRIGAVINFEARGSGGTANLFQTSAQNGHAARLFARHVKDPSASSLAAYVYSVLQNDTDLTPALKRDYVAYNIANIGDAAMYHSPKITPEALSKRSLQHMGSQGLDLSLALLGEDPLPARADNATFFDLFGLTTIIYSPWWGWVFLIGAAVFYVVALRAKNAQRRRSVMRGAVAMTLYLLMGAVALLALNAVSTYGMWPNYYDRLAAIPMLETLALITCLSLALFVFGRLDRAPATHVGAALPLFLLGAAGQAIAPTASYFITLPLLICAMISWFFSVGNNASGASSNTAKIGAICGTVLAALVIGYMIALGHLLLLGVGPDILSVAILPAAIAVLSLLPLWNGLNTKTILRVAGTAAVMAITLALWIRLDPIASTIPPY